ncbi:MAG: hypothetical protein WCA46_19350 [Actinocatenispora sp.]
MLEARTYAEAHLYMDLQQCRCGEYRFDRDHMTMLNGPPDTLTMRFEGACERCGRQRGFTFRLPEHADRPTTGYSFRGDGPSRLLDPGQWFAVSVAQSELNAYVQQQVNPDEAWRDPEAWEDMAESLSNAGDAVAEAYRFVPDGADAVPDGAVWSESGREMLASLGGPLSTELLARRRAECRTALDEFVQRYPEPEV